MKISEKNVFLRLYVKMNDSEPDNFCELFWFSVWAIVIGPVILAAVAGLVLMILEAPWWIWFVGAGIYLLIAGVVFLAVRFVRVPRLAAFGSRTADKIEDFIAVVKNKYCPRLEIIRKQKPVTA